MILFYLPFFYLIHSRLKTKYELVSWQIIFFIPQLLISYFYLDVRSNIFIHLFLISQLIFHSLYETGYIQNDVITTKKEKNPTIRLNKKNKSFVARNYSNLINFRYIVVVIFVFVLFWLDSFTAYNLNLINFLIIIFLTKLIFSIHNNIRNRMTIITYFLLSLLKYTFPIILFLSDEKIFYPILISIIIFPVLRVIEVATLQRYNFKKFRKLIGDIDKFRILYYLFFLICFLIYKLFFLFSDDDFYLAVTIICYFLFFRICCFYLVKYGVYKRK